MNTTDALTDTTVDALLEREFAQDPALIYLNHAAVAPWPQRTAQAVQAFATHNASRGAADYARWTEVSHQLRRDLGALINARPADIGLLKNTSEALSVVAWGLDWAEGDNLVLAREEFPSNRIVWESLAERGVACRYADPAAYAEDPEAALMAAADERTRLLTVSSVQYASGRRMDLRRLGAFCRERGILFCVDAIQSVGALPFDVQDCGADFAMADGHKWMLGPEGVALFYTRPEARDALRLYQYGWHMTAEFNNFDAPSWHVEPSARRFECGSPNMLGIHALQASVGLLLELGMDQVGTRVLRNAAHVIDRVAAEPALELVSSADATVRSGIVTFRHRKLEPAALHKRLLDAGVVCAARGGGVRFSPHCYNTAESIDRALDAACG